MTKKDTVLRKKFDQYKKEKDELEKKLEALKDNFNHLSLEMLKEEMIKTKAILELSSLKLEIFGYDPPGIDYTTKDGEKKFFSPGLKMPADKKEKEIMTELFSFFVDFLSFSVSEKNFSIKLENTFTSR